MSFSEALWRAIQEAGGQYFEDRAFWLGLFAFYNQVAIEDALAVRGQSLEEVKLGYAYAEFEQRKEREFRKLAENTAANDTILREFILEASEDLKKLNLSQGRNNTMDYLNLFKSYMDRILEDILFDKQRGFYQTHPQQKPEP